MKNEAHNIPKNDKIALISLDNKYQPFLNRNNSNKITKKVKNKIYNRLNLGPLIENDFIKNKKENKIYLSKSSVIDGWKKLFFKKVFPTYKNLIIDKDIINSNNIINNKTKIENEEKKEKKNKRY
jgi:hypothetical protein